jgi:hypothetical protein
VRVGVLRTYFLAASDELAAATVDWVGGPLAGPKKRAFRKQESGYLGVDVGGVDPIVELGMLEELLTGKSFDAQLNDPLSRPVVAMRDNGERLVLRIDDRFVEKLAAADPGRLTGLVVPWSEIEEFSGQASVTGLTELLMRLRGLAHHAIDSGEHVYCWICI